MPRRKGYNKVAHKQQQQQQSLNHQKETAKLKKRIIEKVLSSSNNGNMAFNLDLLVDGWLELESDPGTFSLLIEDFGCFGAQVDEVYDLDQKFEGPVFGFIFLFKWLNHQHGSSNSRYQNSTTTSLSQELKSASAKTNGGDNQSSNNNANDQPDGHHWSYVVDENIISEMFFAKQMISNSCATHALISILLNCDHEQLNLGPTLTRLKEHTKVMDPENKGYAIGNVPELAKAHNSHASYSSLYSRDRPNAQRGASSFFIRGNQRTNMQQQQNQPDTYHFVSYVPINDRLYELDGLKSYPIDHGPFDPKEGWTEKFRRVIKRRLYENSSAGGDGTMADDIRYNLMAVVPDKRLYLKSRLQTMRHHLKSAENTLKQLTKQVANSTPIPTVSSCITVATDNRDLNPPHSPCSNGTLTASECESACHDATNQDVQMDNSDNVANNSEIPNPPYSPLSIRTLTASEAGSEYNDPDYYDDSLIRDDMNSKSRVSISNDLEKYYFVKFDSKQEPATSDAKQEDTTSNLDIDKTKAMEDMCKLTVQIKNQIEKLEYALKEEFEKRRKYKLDNSRRTHNYEPFIMTFLSMLAKHGRLADLIERDLGISSLDDQQSTSASVVPQSSAPPIPPPSSQNANATHSHNLKPRLTQKSDPSMQSTSKNKEPVPLKPRNKYYKYVSTGRPRGRPRKNPIVIEPKAAKE